MNEDKTGSVAGDAPRPPPPPPFVKLSDRQIFNVELRPGETTIVSWRKLLRDAEKAGGSTSSAPPLPSNAHPSLESRITSGKPAENEVQDASAPHRFSAVIEKIERLYMGKHSSDEEDLNDYPDDDQYDTEDSFIDDAELDEYFEVDNSEIKHDGFFVNRGKLESISKPTVSPNQQLKKKRKKDLPKPHQENDDGRIPNRDAKVSKVAAGKTALQKNSASSPSQSLASKNEQFEDFKLQNKLNPSEVPSKKKFTGAGISLVDSSFVNVSNGYTSASLAETKKIEKQKMVALQSKSLNKKLKHANGPSGSDGLHQKYLDRSVYAQPKPHPARPLQNVDGVKEKNTIREFTDTNASKYSMHTPKTSHTHKKDASSIKSKGSMLERAIRELERMVAESRPPMENQEADTSSQGIKRRLPTEIKLKLAKVARLAQASHGKISKELINRLMSILGHLIQLRTLKRNLKVMVSMGMSAKQEKDDRFRQIKNEVTEMIKMRIPTLESKASEQQAGRSDDFQEIGSEGKEVPKRKLSMDTALEDKICDLYDLFVDGLDEDAGPQIRKLYAQLAELWPSGLMDNHGIRRAICRAKERRKALYSRHKDQEKIKKKKMLASRSEEAVRVEEGSTTVQPQHVQERCADSGGHVLASCSSKATSSSTVRMPSPSSNGPNTDKPKQDKFKDNSGNSPDDGKVSDSVVLPKKKLKRKQDNGHIHPEKLSSQHEEERFKSYKQASDLPQKSNPASSFEHPS